MPQPSPSEPRPSSVRNHTESSRPPRVPIPRRLGNFQRDRPPKCPPYRPGSLNLSTTGQSLTCLNAPFCRYRAPPLSALPPRLPGHLRSLIPLHQPLLQRHPIRLQFLPRQRHAHPQRPPRLIPRPHPIRLRPPLHQHPAPPQARI